MKNIGGHGRGWSKLKSLAGRRWAKGLRGVIFASDSSPGSFQTLAMLLRRMDSLVYSWLCFVSIAFLPVFDGECLNERLVKLP